MMSAILDISERKKVEQALHAQTLAAAEREKLIVELAAARDGALAPPS